MLYENSTAHDHFGLRGTSSLVIVAAAVPALPKANPADSGRTLIAQLEGGSPTEIHDALPSCTGAECQSERDAVHGLVGALRREMLEMRGKLLRDLEPGEPVQPTSASSYRDKAPPQPVTVEDMAEALDDYLSRLEEVESALGEVDTAVRETVEGLSKAYTAIESLEAHVALNEEVGVCVQERALLVRAVFRAAYGHCASVSESDAVYALRRAIDDLQEAL